MGHQVGTQVERAYRRTDVLDKRRQLMEGWAQWCEPNASGNVIAFGKGAGRDEANDLFITKQSQPARD